MQEHPLNQEAVAIRPPDTQAQNANIEGFLSEHHSRDHNWLSKKFNSFPFLLYQYWMMLNLLIAFFADIVLITQLVELSGLTKSEQILLISFIMSITLVLYGYGEMLSAISQRKSRVAQRSFLKFQYYFIGLLICYRVEITGLFHSSDLAETNMYLYAALNPIINLVGGSAVLKAFRENHPLQKEANLKASDQHEANFLEQNKILASEISKCDRQLGSWPYVVYNWWLKLTAAFEISFIFSLMPYQIWYSLYREEFSPRVFLFIAVLILSFFNSYSRFKMEVAMRTRDLARSKRAVLLLKISIFSSILSYIAVAKELDASAYGEFELFIPSFKRLVLFVAIPVLCLAGALRVHKLIEERNCFAQASSFTSESYL